VKEDSVSRLYLLIGKNTGNTIIDTVQFYYSYMIWTVYILKCFDGKYYIGCTSDMTKRLLAHNRRRVKYTSTRLPLELIVSMSFKDKYRAYEFERYLKSGSGKVFAQRHLY